MSLSANNVGKVCVMHFGEDDKVNDKVAAIVGYYKNTQTSEEYEIISVGSNGQCYNITDSSKRTIIEGTASSSGASAIWQPI